MTPKSDKVVERKFIFEFPTFTTNENYRFEVPIHIPFSGNIRELAQRLITLFKVPVYIERGMFILWWWKSRFTFAEMNEEFPLFQS